MTKKRIVVKIGTNALMKDSRINKRLISDLAEDLCVVRQKGMDVILVTSGAIGFGIELLGIGFPKDVTTQQAMAAIGQNGLMHEYKKAFAKHNQLTAQLLLTQYNFTNKKSFTDLSNSIERLLELGAIPIINENDAVSIEALSEEKKFSDNDGLAALVATNFGADVLVILTDVDGIYSDNPKKNKDATKINGIEGLSKIMIIEGEKSEYGLGGIKSKIAAVKKALDSGVSAIVCKPGKSAVSDSLDNRSSGSVFLIEKIETRTG
ncbi:MAG: glutamate 5-kinase [archaeon]|nr:glutamate 5-kinase [archaeon]